MADDTQQQPQPQTPVDLNAAIQALIRQQIAAASGQGQQVQLPSTTPPPSMYSNDPSQAPDLRERIGLALGGGALPGAPAALQAQMGRQALLNFGIGLMSAGRFATPGEVLAGGLRGAQSGLLGSEAAQAAQQEYALNAQTKLAELGMEQQKNRTAALTALVPLLQMQGRLGQPLFGGGAGGPGGGDTAFTGDPTHDLPLIAQRESGGDPTALNYVAKADPTAYDRGATASGKYQIVNSTWREGMQLAGLDPSQYPTARAAPEAVQDKVAQALYAKYGTAPWDASKFGANWVQQPGGGYQLVKGAPPPATGPGSAVGPYKIAGPPNTPPPSTPPPAPSSAPPAGGLPVPPVPPAGAPSTIATPEDAAAVAKATGNRIAVPGVSGQWATPEGGVSGTPPVLGPETAVGPVAPPPAATPAAPTPSGEAVPPPPAAPAPPAAQPSRHDLVMEKNPDGTYKMPDDQVSQNEFLEREKHIYSPQELQDRGVILPDNPAEAQAKFAAVQQANAAADAARTAASALYGTMKDPSDAIKQVNAANEQAQKARQDYATYLQGANEKNADALQKIYQQQDDRNAAAYKAQVIDPKAAQVAAQAQLDRELALAHAQAGETRSTDALKTTNANMAAASDRIDQLQLLRGLSANVGNATGIGDMKIGGRSLADLISLTGFGPEAWQEKASAVQAFRNGILNLTRSLREGGAATGEPRSNQDLNFVLGMAPSELQDPRTREAILTYLEQVNQRHLNIGAETSRLMQTYLPGTKDYMPYGQALLEAREKYKDFLPQMDAATAADPEARKAWAAKLPDHSFWRDPSGAMHMWPPPATSQTQAQPQMQAPPPRSRGPQPALD